MKNKTVLIVDDEQGFAEALQDALEYEDFRVLKATNGDQALHILKTDQVDLVTLDIMMPPGPSLEKSVTSDQTGVFLCSTISKQYPYIYVICLSVVSNRDVIKQIEKLNVRFLRKGEVPLRTVLDHIVTKLRGRTF